MDIEPPPLYRHCFGTVEYDEALRELSVAGAKATIQQKPREILAFLLQHVDELVTRKDIGLAVWHGRPIGLAPFDNALNKLRKVIGTKNGERIVTTPKEGYMLVGPVERILIKPTIGASALFKAGDAIPGNEDFTLAERLSVGQHGEVWLARDQEMREQRVYKFSTHAQGLMALKREAALSAYLSEHLGDRPDLVYVSDWRFEAPPYFLEYEYAGENLGTWAATHLSNLGLTECVDLFLQIADAVAAAHSVGVIHKDLKPSNILVSDTEHGPQVRVIDFGSARVFDQSRLLARGDMTQHGLTATQGIASDAGGATPYYIAPERLAGRAATLQSDVFALGVILYQILVRNLQSWPLPSSWEGDITDAELRKDIATAMDKNPDGRYSSAAVLALQVRSREARRAERQLEADREVFRARRPLFIAIASGLMVAVAVSSWGYYNELHNDRLLKESNRQLAESNRQLSASYARAETVARFLNVLSAVDPFAGDAHQNRTIRAALEEAAASVQGHFAKDPLTEASIRMELGTVYVRIAESDAAVTQWRRVVALLESSTRPGDPRLIESRYWLGQALALTSRLREAQQILQTADRDRVKYGSDPRLELLSDRSWDTYYLNLQQDESAIPYFERAVMLLQQLTPWDLLSLDLTRIALGQCYTGVSKFRQSEQLARDLISQVQQRDRPSELILALARYVYGESLIYQKRYRDAEPLLDQAYNVVRERLGADNLRTLVILNARCDLYSMSHQGDKALQCMSESYTQTRLRFTDQHWSSWGILSNIGIEEFLLKRYADAVRSLSRAHEGLGKTLGEKEPLTQLCAYYFARSLLKRGDAERAAELAAVLTPQGVADAEPGAPWEKRLLLLHGLVLVSEHRNSEALPFLRPAAHMSLKDDPEDTIIQDAQEALAKLNTQRATT